jgi:Tol biopolymer transport system component
MGLTTGTRVGPYEIVGPLGAGGMGEVYRARDSKISRDVALKVLPELVAADPERLARFHREAQLLGALNHPNIAQIYGFEDSGTTHALVMELVEGPTLADRIAQGPIPVEEALPIARQIAMALEAAHEQGIVHRDLKPANVKVREDGTVKVLDFGLAKAMDPTATSGADLSNSPTQLTAATQFGTILGTASYMAPEQAKGKAVDRRADIWAFGVVLFEMLSGERPFKGDDVSDVLAAVLRQEVDWKALPANTPPNVRRVLERCLVRDPKQRLRDIGDVWLGMDGPDAAIPVAPMAAPPARTSLLTRALPWAVTALIAAASAAWIAFHQPTPDPRVVTRSMQLNKDISAFVTVSNDGTRLAYATVDGKTGAPRISVRQLDQFEEHPVPGSEGGAYAAWSPDDQWIAYSGVVDSKLRKIPLSGGPSTPIADGSLLNGGAWGPDNTIVFAGPKGLMRVSGDGGTPEALTTVDTAKGELAHIRPQWLPGGKRVLFTVVSAGAAQSAIWESGTSGYRAIAHGGMGGRYVASGHLVFLRGSTLFAAPFDVTRLEVIGGEVPMVDGVSTAGGAFVADFSTSDAGVLSYFFAPGSQDTTLAWADRSGVTKPLPGQSRQLWGTGRLSPDGKLVVNGITNDKGGRDIWTYDVDRGTLTRLTFASKETNDFPIWSPDGRTVYFSGLVDGKRGLCAVAADASGKAKLILATPSAATPTSVAPDGKALVYYQSAGDKRNAIFVLPLVPGGSAAEAHPLHEASGSEIQAEVSPDSHWVAYSSNESGAPEVYVVPFPGPGPKVRISLDGGSAPRWSRDGRELLYWASTPNARLMSVDVQFLPTFRAGQPHELFHQLSTTTWDTSRDPNKFLIEISSRSTGSSLAIVTNWFEELKKHAPAKR